MVFLTVHYMFATTAQAWRFRSIYQKITRVLDNQRSVVFMRIAEPANEEGPSSSSVRLVECGKTSNSVGGIGECIWTSTNSQALSVDKIETVSLLPFITFPRSSSHSSIPFRVAEHKFESADFPSADVIYALIEVEWLADAAEEGFVEVEQFGNLLAWRCDKKFTIMLETNAKLLSKFMLLTFLQDQLLLNEFCKLLRVSTVKIKDEPYSIEKLALSDEDSNFEDLESRINELKRLSYIVHGGFPHSTQASIVDLVSYENSKSGTPKKQLDALKNTADKINELKVELKRQEALKSPFNSMVNMQELDTSETSTTDFPSGSPKFPMSSSKGSSLFKSESSSISQKFPASPEKRSSSTSSVAVSKEPSPPKFTIGEEDEEDEVEVKVKVTPKKVEKVAAEVSKVETAEKPPPIANVVVQPPPKPEPVAPPKPVKIVRTKNAKTAQAAKPPNILVYSESAVTRDNVIKSLQSILAENTYTVYPLTPQQVTSRIWMDNARLLIVCGSANGTEIGHCFMDFFIKGGKVLCLCSDLLGLVLPTYHTAEVREHELVQFSYGKWQNIKMMHHIFCYQPSPIRKHFSHDSDDPPREPSPRAENPLQVLLRSVELKDRFGISHNIRVKTLGTEDTWKTPSLLMIHTDDGGKMIFSQIHLEIDPSIYENDEQKYAILKQNDGLRLEIFSDVLNSHLDISVKQNALKDVKYCHGYFLGRHELKFEVLEQLKDKIDQNKTLKLESVSITFCGKGDDVPRATENVLPIMMHACPEDFSTLQYFDILRTDHIGRLLIYADVMKSSSAILDKTKYVHGIAIVPRKLTAATGRGSNQWLSPEGCLMFSLQMHIALDSPLGSRLSLVQHLVAVAVVGAIRKQPGCHDIDICIKWPNDIYVDGAVKVGGLIVNSILEGNLAICNIGLGLNLTNSTPTTCINDFIAAQNKINSKNIASLSYEKCLAIIFNEIEFILNRVQQGDMNYLIESYYAYWLHSDTSVKLMSKDGTEKCAQIVGIDDFGFLSVRREDTKEVISVQPDGNSFDMIRGLIHPKN